MEVPSIFLNRILSDMAKRGASSLHLSVGSKPMSRVNDELVFFLEENILSIEIINQIIHSFLDEKEIVKLNEDKELIVVRTFASNFRFRVNIFYQKGLPSLSFNYIPNKIRPLDASNLAPLLKEYTNLKSGLILISGSHDSGKTATIASFIEHINANKKKYIITLEDPIEYLFVNKKSIVEQRQIGRDVKSYVDGLEHCLEEDVDIVYIDEARKELDLIMPHIFDLASGNALVIMEINSKKAIGAIEKVLNVIGSSSLESGRYSLADVLVGVIVQKLIPKVGGGMALALEIMSVNSAIRSLIREGKTYQIENIMQTSRNEGMISMDKSVEELTNAGEIQLDRPNKINDNNEEV